MFNRIEQTDEGNNLVQCDYCGHKEHRLSDDIVVIRNAVICAQCVREKYPESAEMLGLTE